MSEVGWPSMEERELVHELVCSIKWQATIGEEDTEV